jgi:uncharacterized protein YjbI with pentapeptide repeats
MADPTHVEIIKKGVDGWNQWRKDNAEITPDLSSADLNKLNLNGVDFSNTNFDRTNLTSWQVINCNFDKATLTNISAQGSYWRNATLSRTEISGDLTASNFYVADLTGAYVHNCGFPFCELRFLRLNNTKFAGYFGDTDLNSWTVIDSDLSGIQNLSAGNVEYPFNIDFLTLRNTAAGLKEDIGQTNKFSNFFKDSGIPEEIIAVFRTWVKIKPTIAEASVQSIEFYSCFISYSHEDRKFAKSLQGHLQKNNIQCWFDEEHVLPGDNILDAVDNGIRRWDKVLLCCSENSLNSPYVDREIDKALQKEEDLWRERGKKILTIIPLNLDGFLFEWESSKASILKSRLAADFTDWENNEANFDLQLNQILKALRADGNARPKVPEAKL